MAATRVDGLLIQRAADEILVLKAGSSEAHALNQSASVVFDLCDGTASKSQMAAEIQRRTGLPADEEIVDLALSELADAGVIALASEPQAGVTRRALMRRLSLTAAAVAMLPIVETILVPPASAQSSTPTPTPILL